MTIPQEKCLIHLIICTSIKPQRSEVFGVSLVGFLNEIAQSIKMPERRIVKSSVVASICLEIGEVVEEQALFDLDVIAIKATQTNAQGLTPTRES